jgi:hypothetical protein
MEMPTLIFLSYFLILLLHHDAARLSHKNILRQAEQLQPADAGTGYGCCLLSNLYRYLSLFIH